MGGGYRSGRSTCIVYLIVIVLFLVVYEGMIRPIFTSNSSDYALYGGLSALGVFGLGSIYSIRKNKKCLANPSAKGCPPINKQ